MSEDTIIVRGEELLSQREVAALLRVYRGRVIQLTRDGKLPHLRLGERTIRYRRSDVERFIDSQIRQGAVA